MSILPEEAPDVVLYETGPIKLSNPEIATAVKKSLYIGVYDQVVWDKGPALLGFKLEEEKEIRRRLLVVGRDLSREPVTTDIASLTRYLDYQPNQFPTTIWNIIEQGNDNRTAPIINLQMVGEDLDFESLSNLLLKHQEFMDNLTDLTSEYSGPRNYKLREITPIPQSQETYHKAKNWPGMYSHLAQKKLSLDYLKMRLGLSGF